MGIASRMKQRAAEQRRERTELLRLFPPKSPAEKLHEQGQAHDEHTCTYCATERIRAAAREWGRRTYPQLNL